MTDSFILSTLLTNKTSPESLQWNQKKQPHELRKLSSLEHKMRDHKNVSTIATK